MKKNLALFLCITVLALLCLASCEECEHTFSDEWYSDETNHWHPATCEHAETERGDFGPHIDEAEDGICDICNLPIGHVHTFENSWQSNDTHHWKNATCSHTDEKGEYSTHSDEDINGVCDLCEAHVHKVNAAGYCDHSDCGMKVKDIDETKLEELVPAVFVQKYLVNGGTIDYGFTGRSNTSASYQVLRNEQVSYIFGKNNFTNIKVNTTINNGGVDGSGTLETWHQLSSADQAFGLYSENGGALSLDIAEADKLNGYYIALSTLAGDYGVEATLYALYEAAMSDTTTDLVVSTNTEDNKVTFAYDYNTIFINETDIAVGEMDVVYNANYFEVEVTFTYTDDYALTSLEIYVDCYTNDPGTSQTDGFLYDDVDIQYDPETGEFTFVKYNHETQEYDIVEKSTPDTYVINVTQTVGERAAENPHPKEKFIPSNFDLYLNIAEDGTLSNKLKGDISITAGEIVNFYVGDCTPDGTSIHFVADLVNFKLYKDGALIENAEDYLNSTAVAMFTFGGSQRSFFVVPKVDGTYKFEVYIGDKLIKSVNIYAGIVNIEDIVTKDNEFAVVVTEAYEWTNEVSFTATESGTYYFNLPAGVGMIDADGFDQAGLTPETDDGPEPYFDYNNAKDPNGGYIPGSFHIDLEAGQTIRFYVNSVKKGAVIISFACI